MLHSLNFTQKEYIHGQNYFDELKDYIQTSPFIRQNYEQTPKIHKVEHIENLEESEIELGDMKVKEESSVDCFSEPNETRKPYNSGDFKFDDFEGPTLIFQMRSYKIKITIYMLDCVLHDCDYLKNLRKYFLKIIRICFVKLKILHTTFQVFK